MGRIRSVHPGLFTDEAFVTVSEAAQIFFIGLLVEADDQGIFEWKPVTLRLRLRGNKDGPVEPLLSELATVDSIRSYELNGRKYGAIRNFCKYQRPKKPNSIHPITDEIRTYVDLSARGSEPGDVQTGGSSELDGVEKASIPKKSELGPQMKDEGGRMEDNKSSLRSDSSKNGTEQPELLPGSKPDSTARRRKNTDEISLEFDSWYREYPRHEARGDAEKAYRQARKSGVSADELMAGAKRYARQRRGEDAKFTKLPATWLRARCWLDETPQQPAPNGEAEATPEQLEILKRGALREWADSGKWRNERWIGPPPDDPQTRITPADIAAVPEARMKLTEMRVA